MEVGNAVAWNLNDDVRCYGVVLEIRPDAIVVAEIGAWSKWGHSARLRGERHDLEPDVLLVPSGTERSIVARTR